jgi:beta-xylosidase
MKRHWYLLFACVSIIILSCKGADKTEETVHYTTPVSLADPFIMLHDDVYYAYGTSSENGIEVYTSDNLEEWKIAPDLALHKNNSFGNKWFWAPEVYQVNGKFYMYYSAEEHMCVAVSDSPIGPFKQETQEPMLEGEKTIDNSLFIDEDGTPYLFFDRFNDGLNIWVAELEEDLMTIKTETLHPCIHVSQEWEEVWPRVNEGAFVIKHKGIYYMTYSANSYESQFYGIGCATATDIMGEWIKYPDNPLLQKPGNLVGVGHSSLFRDKTGDLRIVFHAHHDDKNIHPRKMYIGRVGFKQEEGADKLYINQEYLTPKLVVSQD